MIIFIYGTSAEAIKIAPVSRRLKSQHIEQEHWLTFQHADTLPEILPKLGLPLPYEVIANGAKGRSLSAKSDVVKWLATCAFWGAKNIARVKKRLPKDSIVVVHGDTMTSVVGAVLGKVLGYRVAHIEAGLRSGNWRHPFPEELNRRLVGKLASIHYAPSPEAALALQSKQSVVHTYGNTVQDAVLDHSLEVEDRGDKLVGVVLLHRFEFVTNVALIESTLTTISVNTLYPVVLLVDALSVEPIVETIHGLGITNLKVSRKLNHLEFIELLGRAAYVVTDSGGVQEECALLGIPTIVHRKATERPDGIGRNIQLSMWDMKTLQNFLRNPEGNRHKPIVPAESPSDLIVHDLKSRFGGP